MERDVSHVLQAVRLKTKKIVRAKSKAFSMRYAWVIIQVQKMAREKTRQRWCCVELG